jgi:site-specific DNA-cytosine methylase
MNILVACEESQEVTKIFREKGHNAFSCDIQDCSGGHPEWHIKSDVTELLKQKWDMIIAFPPCTHLAVSGAAHFARKKADGRQKEGIDFFMLFTNLECKKVAIENPVGIMSNIYRKPDQIIRPFNFGENSTKKTCLWLKGLPPLMATKIIDPTKHTTKTGKIYDEWWFKTCLVSDLQERAKQRSKTFPGIAQAMADQWG